MIVTEIKQTNKQTNSISDHDCLQIHKNEFLYKSDLQFFP